MINEITNVSLRKLNLQTDDITKIITFLTQKCELKNINLSTIQLAISYVKKYGYSYFDCLMLASAIENNCTIIYSEDLQHNQLIEGQLRIINPFV